MAEEEGVGGETSLSTGAAGDADSLPRGAGGKEGRRRAGVPWKLFGGALGRHEKK